MPNIKPFLWFDDNAMEAVDFYRSVFVDLEITHVSRWPEDMPEKAGSVLVVAFTLFGLPHLAMNGGPGHEFNDAVSLMVECDTQDEIDRYWAGLSEGGTPIACGWIKDRFGMTWQITPRVLGELIGQTDPVKAKRVMDAMMAMVKLDIPTLQKAAE